MKWKLGISGITWIYWGLGVVLGKSNGKEHGNQDYAVNV